MTATRFPDGYREDRGVFRLTTSRQAEGGADSEAERISAILTSASDLSTLSLELRREAVDWPTKFHLSPRRANALRPLAPLLQGRVLEVGAGCGALTRFLGESGAKVHALEASPARAAVARQRTRDLPNVTVICDRVEDIAFAEPFDVITLIGAQAYTRVPGADGDYLAPVLACLKAKLKPGGVLILADDNRLGLKYFAGAAEAGSGRPFDGLNDFQAGEGAPTTGRRELAGRIADAGFVDASWYYPFPDYRLPTTVLSGAGLQPASAGVFTPLFAGSNFEDLLKPRPATFSLEQAWGVVARNGLAEDLANAFVVVCRAPGRSPKREEAALAWHYTVDRHPAFAKVARFERDAEGGLVVRRSTLEQATAPEGPVRLVLEDETFFQGPLWSSELGQVLNQPGWTADAVAAWLRFWINRLLAEAGIGPGADLRVTEVPGRLLDAMPFNLVVGPDGRSHFIDLEWEHERPISVLYLAYHALNKSLIRTTTCAAPARDRHLLVNLLIRDVLREVGLTIDVSMMRDFEQQDRAEAHLNRFGVHEAPKRSRLRMLVRILKTRPGEADSLVQRLLQLARGLFGK